MAIFTNRRTFLGMLASTLAALAVPIFGQVPGGSGPRAGPPPGRPRRDAEDYNLPADLAEFALLSVVLGRPSDTSVTVSALAKNALEGFFEYGTTSGDYKFKTKLAQFPVGQPAETMINDLQPDTGYYYRLQYRKPGEDAFKARAECRFHTQRAAGSAFTFAVQGDSHPERPQMNDPALYARTLQQAAADRPDFYLCMGDDFSIDTLRAYTTDTVGARYTLQRPFLGLVARSAALFLVNGNHEQASLYNYNQKDVPHDAAVWAQNARNRYFPLPVPDAFYAGDKEELKSIGPLRDYYAWTWGDALFVVLDNYWHSPELVDNPLGEKPGDNAGNKKNRDLWASTLGDAQYQWLKKTLAESRAKYKFVFAHHVLGTGRGGTDEADLYEWGGKDKRGDDQFKQHRPNWDLPIHQLLVKHDVTIFFQGHDHLYARQERDGVVYQEVPVPADPGYVTYNEDRYAGGTKIANSGYLRVAVSPEQVKVEYVRCYLPKDENGKQKTGDVAHSYTIKPRGHA